MLNATLRSGKRTIALIAIAFGLAACSSMAELEPGTQYSQVLQSYGQPVISCDEAPYTLAVWSQQPMGYYAWRGVFDQNEQLIEMQQVLSDPAFAQVEKEIKQKVWDIDRIGCNFGPPAEQSYAPYIGVKMKVWTYRYKQNNVWPMMMNIFFDDDGYVHALQRSMDPRDNDGKFWFGS